MSTGLQCWTSWHPCYIHKPQIPSLLMARNMLWVEIRLFHGITWKAFQGPMQGDCGMVTRFIHVEGCPCVRSLTILPWKKVQPCLQQGQNKSLCPEFLLHIKAQSFRTHITCCGLQQLLDSHDHVFWARASMPTHGVSIGHEQERVIFIEYLCTYITQL